MSGGGRQAGFSLVELMVASMVLIVVFSGAFLVLKKARDATSPQSSTGPHLYFESFATSRLKLYFSKLLQWTTQVPPNFCFDASKFAYAGNKDSSGRELETLGADMRMALSTFSYTRALNLITGKPGKLAGRFDDSNEFPWAALVPFDSRSDSISGIKEVQPALSSFCGEIDDGAGNELSGGDVVAEMCAWVDVCSAQEADRTPNPPNGNLDLTVPLLSRVPLSTGDLSSLIGINQFRMCFAFVGNLFSRTGNYVASSAGSSTGVESIDNPAVLGLAVATVDFIDLDSGTRITCDDARFEMNRSFRVDANLFTVTNADKSSASKKQGYKKSRKQFVSEKFGIPVPNCNNTSRNLLTNGVGMPICLGDPPFFYACPIDCVRPD